MPPGTGPAGQPAPEQPATSPEELYPLSFAAEELELSWLLEERGELFARYARRR